MIQCSLKVGLNENAMKPEDRYEKVINFNYNSGILL